MIKKQSEERLVGVSDLLSRVHKSSLARAIERSPLPLSEASSHIEEARALIASGLVTLRIVQYAWGLDFELVSTQGYLGGEISE
jgi:hypothetical protein